MFNELRQVGVVGNLFFDRRSRVKFLEFQANRRRRNIVNIFLEILPGNSFGVFPLL